MKKVVTMKNLKILKIFFEKNFVYIYLHKNPKNPENFFIFYVMIKHYKNFNL